MTKVIFVGNCQAQALYGAYLTWIAPGREETVQYVPAYEEADDAAIERIRQADLIALQITDADQKVNLADIGARGRVVRFPMVTAMFLWPFHSGAHPRDANIPAEYRRVFTGNFGDRWLDRRLAAGEDPRAIVEHYRQPAVVSEARLDRMIELVAQKQQERDAQADMKLGDYIMRHLTTERVFIHLHHPNLALFQLMLREVFARMDCTTAEIERAVGAYRASPFPPEEPPVHPRIAEHLGLQWATPGLAYRFYFGERLTWETFCARYVAHDWNHPLQHCLSFAHRDLPRDELERIVTELEPAAARYDSSEGYFALSDMRRRLGDLPGSLAALDRALASDPLSLPCLARRAELLLETDCAEEGMQAARDLVSWQPGFVQARITLFESYSRLGRLDDALAQARAALALEPHHPHILHRLADFERGLADQQARP
jgi:tetratricopeptide (TPR) repeat protein